jgi:hypothetical protein
MSKFLSNPTYKLDLSVYRDFTQICHDMKDLGITKYVYYFVDKKGIIKYGYSADNSIQYGERVYRQAGHLHGWNRRLEGSSGSDMRIICDRYYDKYQEPLDRNNITLYIIRMNGQTESDCRDLERHLINECIKNNNGRAPLGNKDPETRLFERREKNTKQFLALIEEEITECP